MHQGIRSEAFDIMHQEEIVQKNLPIAEVAEQVPRERHHQEWRHYARPDQVAGAAEAQT